MGNAVGGCAGAEGGRVSPCRICGGGVAGTHAGPSDCIIDLSKRLDVAQENFVEVERQLHVVARRDWAVRVLDAWAEDRFGTEGFHATMRRDVDPGDHTRYQWQCRVAYIEAGRTRIRIEKYGESADAARLAAAEAVWPELPESVRAELGERP